MQALVLLLQHLHPLLQLLQLLLEFLTRDLQRVLRHCLLLPQITQAPLRYLDRLNIEVAVYDVLYGEVFLCLLLVTVESVNALLSAFLDSLLFELFEVQRFLPVLLAFLDVLLFQVIYCCLPLLQGLLLLPVLHLETLKHLLLLPYFLHKLSQFATVFVFLLLLD